MLLGQTRKNQPLEVVLLAVLKRLHALLSNLDIHFVARHFGCRLFQRIQTRITRREKKVMGAISERGLRHKWK
jgi:hypothetical protein